MPRAQAGSSRATPWTRTSSRASLASTRTRGQKLAANSWLSREAGGAPREGTASGAASDAEENTSSSGLTSTATAATRPRAGAVSARGG